MLIATVRCGLPGALRSSPSLGIQLSYSGHSYVAVLFHLGTSTSHVSNVVCFVRAMKNLNIKFSTFSIVLPKPHGIDQQGLPVFRFSSGFPSLTQKLPSKKPSFGSIGQASPQPWRGKCSRRQRNQWSRGPRKMIRTAAEMTKIQKLPESQTLHGDDDDDDDIDDRW